MKFGLPISLALHGSLLAVSVIGFGFKAKAVPQSQVIPVKIFTISDTTNVRAAKKAPAPKPVEIPEDIAPTPEREPEAVPEPAPKPEAKAEAKAETPAGRAPA